uniref:Uncharacterized protein n=1 Tax=Arundo donax TaxID=35708 RepID=A0A0A9C2Q1_ARUDO
MFSGVSLGSLTRLIYLGLGLHGRFLSRLCGGSPSRNL